MPKDSIEAASMEEIAQLMREGKKGVWIPQARSKPCAWKQPKKQLGTWIPLAELRDILIFALHNAFIRMPDGTIRKQTLGIPMGDPLSPGMTILTASWMEKEFCWYKPVPGWGPIPFPP